MTALAPSCAHQRLHPLHVQLGVELFGEEGEDGGDGAQVQRSPEGREQHLESVSTPAPPGLPGRCRCPASAWAKSTAERWNCQGGQGFFPAVLADEKLTWCAGGR